MYYGGAILGYCLYIAQLHSAGCLSAPVFIDGSIVLLGCIDILVTEYICHKVNISGLFIKRRAIRTPKLVGGDFLIWSHLPGVFPDHIFDGLNAHTPALG